VLPNFDPGGIEEQHDQEARASFLDNWAEMQKTWSKTYGMERAMHITAYYMRHFDTSRVSTGSPFFPVMYLPNKAKDEVNFFFNCVLDLASIDFTHKYFGLSFNDLLQLDYHTFTQIEERIIKMMKERKDKNLDVDLPL